MNLWAREELSIREFVKHAASLGVFTDRDVLDYGCGQQPYRDIVEQAGGRYFGYDRVKFPASCADDDTGNPMVAGAILCTQVMQYIVDAPTMIASFAELLRRDGALVITWPTNWPETETEDIHRFTAAGMQRMLETEFSRVEMHERAHLMCERMKFPLGHGAIAWK